MSEVIRENPWFQKSVVEDCKLLEINKTVKEVKRGGLK